MKKKNSSKLQVRKKIEEKKFTRNKGISFDGHGFHDCSKYMEKMVLIFFFFIFNFEKLKKIQKNKLKNEEDSKFILESEKNQNIHLKENQEKLTKVLKSYFHLNKELKNNWAWEALQEYNLI